MKVTVIGVAVGNIPACGRYRDTCFFLCRFQPVGLLAGVAHRKTERRSIRFDVYPFGYAGFIECERQDGRGNFERMGDESGFPVFASGGEQKHCQKAKKTYRTVCAHGMEKGYDLQFAFVGQVPLPGYKKNDSSYGRMFRPPVHSPLLSCRMRAAAACGGQPFSFWRWERVAACFGSSSGGAGYRGSETSGRVPCSSLCSSGSSVSGGVVSHPPPSAL